MTHFTIKHAPVTTPHSKPKIFCTFHYGMMLLMTMTALCVQGMFQSAQAQTSQFSHYAPSSKTVIDHHLWNQILGTYVTTLPSGLNAVNYKKLKAKDGNTLRTYLKKMQAVKITNYNRNEQFSFWANLYNAKTLDIIIQYYPVATIRDIDISGLFSNGPWGKKVVTIEGQSLSLNDIEHQILRPIWKDPRIHYAVNCASIGCPNLRKTAFNGAELENQLDQAARDYINSERGVKVSAAGRLTASKIFNWYGKDFGGTDAALLRHFRQYAAPSLKQKLQKARSISSYFYNWHLNEIK